MASERNHAVPGESAEMITVEVVYALPDKQQVIAVTLPKGSTVQQAIDASHIQDYFPGMDLAAAKVGIFSQRATRETVLQPGYRVEIYRPLALDPTEIRRRRAAAQQKKQTK